MKSYAGGFIVLATFPAFAVAHPTSVDDIFVVPFRTDCSLLENPGIQKFAIVGSFRAAYAPTFQKISRWGDPASRINHLSLRSCGRIRPVVIITEKIFIDLRYIAVLLRFHKSFEWLLDSPEENLRYLADLGCSCVAGAFGNSSGREFSPPGAASPCSTPFRGCK